ncbi:MAG: hypothetical protein KDD56_07685 [Bdellovibrionales bacterium]|nr:hypothetical protein [Bdellovibrionales bacterium]
MKKFLNLFEKTVSLERLFGAWHVFRKGKIKRYDVQNFERHLEVNIFKLHQELMLGTYRHGAYSSFYIHDPKLRHIRKAKVKDRLVHQTVCTTLYEIFEATLISDVYSSRLGKGTHKAVYKLREAARRISKNYTKVCWALKCDVKRFYDSVDHNILLNLLAKPIKDQKLLKLLEEIIYSFHTLNTTNKGMPIGNLTSQIFTNIYLSKLDYYVKHNLRQRYYFRYADDFIILSCNKEELQGLTMKLKSFLNKHLTLKFHPQKVILKPLHHGFDFLGYVIMPYHCVLRTKTKRCMKKRLSKKLNEFFADKLSSKSYIQTINSYLGILSHANQFHLQQKIQNEFFIATSPFSEK